jgi:threonine dehydrogenase-like Zn-dependent dehydrogenase
MGATHTVNADKENAAAVVNDLTEGMGADIVFEAVGHNTDTINQAMRLTRVGGTVLVFGVPDIDTYPIDYTNFFRKNLRLVASVTSTQPALDHGLAMELISRGQIDVRPMISHELPYTEVQRGIDMVADRTDNALKVIFNFPM